MLAFLLYLSTTDEWTHGGRKRWVLHRHGTQPLTRLTTQVARWPSQIWGCSPPVNRWSGSCTNHTLRTNLQHSTETPRVLRSQDSSMLRCYQVTARPHRQDFGQLDAGSNPILCVLDRQAASISVRVALGVVLHPERQDTNSTTNYITFQSLPRHDGCYEQHIDTPRNFELCQSARCGSECVLVGTHRRPDPADVGSQLHEVECGYLFVATLWVVWSHAHCIAMLANCISSWIVQGTPSPFNALPTSYVSCVICWAGSLPAGRPTSIGGQSTANNSSYFVTLTMLPKKYTHELTHPCRMMAVGRREGWSRVEGWTKIRATQTSAQKKQNGATELWFFYWSHILGRYAYLAAGHLLCRPRVIMTIIQCGRKNDI